MVMVSTNNSKPKRLEKFYYTIHSKEESFHIHLCNVVLNSRGKYIVKLEYYLHNPAKLKIAHKIVYVTNKNSSLVDKYASLEQRHRN